MSFLVFVTTFFSGFTRTEKKCIRLIDDDMNNRVIKFKTKNEITIINRNYSKPDKKYEEELNTFMSIMLMIKLTLYM